MTLDMGQVLCGNTEVRPAALSRPIFKYDRHALTKVFMSKQHEKQILNSWTCNVEQWTRAIENGEISSREQITNQAILNAIFSNKVKSLIDIGCGEGWLMRAVAARGVKAVGIDGVKLFIENQHEDTNTEYLHVDYNSISPQLFVQRFDIAVCNFSLLGDSSVRTLLAKIPAILDKANGRLIIQTLHPVFTNTDKAYQSGWREGSWEGFSESFVDPAPWYFRTLEDWLSLFKSSQLEVESIVEPRASAPSKPVSIIFTLSV